MADTASSSDDTAEDIEMKRSSVSSPINIPWHRKESSTVRGFAESPNDGVPSFSSSFSEMQTPDDTIHFGDLSKEVSSAEFAADTTRPTPEVFDGMFGLENLPAEARNLTDHGEDVSMDEQFPEGPEMPSPSTVAQEGGSCADTPTSSRPPRSLPTAGIEGMPLPTAGIEGMPLPTAGIEGMPLTTAGIEGMSLPMAGIEGMPLPTVGIEGVPLPMTGIEGMPLPTVGIEEMPLPTAGIEEIPLPMAGIEGMPLPMARIEGRHDNSIETETGQTAAGLHRLIGRRLAMVGDSLDAASHAYHSGDQSQMDGRNGLLPGRNGIINRRRHL